MAASWERSLNRWLGAGLIDAATAKRIRSFEAQQAPSQGLRLPVLLALAFGGLALAAGVLLFVAAHWEELSPAARFFLVVLLVASFHVAGALATERFHALAVTLHALGTVALGAGIFLAGQIFNLEEHWPSGVLLWALGAWIGWAVLRDSVQPTLAALLTPAWLAGEWIEAAIDSRNGGLILAMGLLLLSITYLTACTSAKETYVRKALGHIGGVTLIPLVILLTYASRPAKVFTIPASAGLTLFGWLSAWVLPLGLAAALRERAAWTNVMAGVWVFVLYLLSGARWDATVYLWCAIGSAGLAAWGLEEARRERINLATVGFGLTVLIFYFSEVMDKLERSLSLILLGVLLLVGGWFLERLRRRLVAEVGGRAS